MGATSIHFSNAELSCRHCGQNGCTQELVDALEILRTLIGKPIHINSAFRCAEWNEHVGGVKTSQHLLGNAADIRVDGMTPMEVYLVAKKVSTFQGFGRDDHHGFLHVDVRRHTARWCYDKDGKDIAWYFPKLGGTLASTSTAT